MIKSGCNGTVTDCQQHGERCFQSTQETCNDTARHIEVKTRDEQLQNENENDKWLWKKRRDHGIYGILKVLEIETSRAFQPLPFTKFLHSRLIHRF